MTRNQFKFYTFDKEITELYGNIRGLKKVETEKTASNKNKFYKVANLRNKPNSKKTKKKIKISKLKKYYACQLNRNFEKIIREENFAYNEYGEEKYRMIINHFNCNETKITEKHDIMPKSQKVLSSRVRHEKNSPHSHVFTAIDLSALPVK